MVLYSFTFIPSLSPPPNNILPSHITFICLPTGISVPCHSLVYVACCCGRHCSPTYIPSFTLPPYHKTPNNLINILLSSLYWTDRQFRSSGVAFLWTSQHLSGTVSKRFHGRRGIGRFNCCCIVALRPSRSSLWRQKAKAVHGYIRVCWTGT